MPTAEANTLAQPERYSTAMVEGLRPDPQLTVDEWADQYAQLPSRVAESGQWRTSRTPFLREIMQCLSPSHPCSEVVFMKSHQIGGTQCAINWMGYVIHMAPAPMMVVEPTVDVATKLSKHKVQPMIDCTPVLRSRIKEARSRDSGNTILEKEFPGGSLIFVGSNSGVALRSVSIKNLVIDEADGFEQDVDGEGHPAELAKNRTSTFARRKIFILSTPKEASTSFIEPAYEQGSRGRYYVPCPHCYKVQWLKFAGLVFTFDGVKQPENAAFRCEHCGELIPEYKKTWMLEMGSWIHEDPANPVRSFHINAFYMPYGWPLSWAEIARRWIRAHRLATKRHDFREKKIVFQTIFAETWKDEGEKIQRHEIWNRREDYAAPCPEGVLVLTAAVDVQDDRLEAEIVGWGVGEESWSIDYRRFYGDPAKKDVWRDLSDWLQRRRTHESGIGLKVEMVAVDTGGHYTKESYEFVKTYRGGRIWGVKGSSQPGAPLVSPRPSKVRMPDGSIRMNVRQIGTVAAKDTLFSRLKLPDFGHGYMHFPIRDEYDEEYFEQLTSEEKVLKYKRGILEGHFYRKTRARNEALDLRVYNMAALAILNPNLEGRHNAWEKYVAKVKIAPEPKPNEPMVPRTSRRVLSRGVE